MAHREKTLWPNNGVNGNMMTKEFSDKILMDLFTVRIPFLISQDWLRFHHPQSFPTAKIRAISSNSNSHAVSRYYDKGRVRSL